MPKDSRKTAAWFPERRPVFTLLCILCVGTLLAWVSTVGSRWVRQLDGLGTTPIVLSVEDGVFHIDWNTVRPMQSAKAGGWALGPDWLPFGIECRTLAMKSRPDTMHMHRVHARLWLIALLFAAYPLFASYRLYRNRRPPPGHCHKCKYNLTGNVSGVCPECGTPTKCEG